MVPHPVQEHAVDHDIGFCERINAVRFHLPPGLSLPAVTAPEQRTKNTDTEKTAAAPPNDTDHLVAVRMARPEIKSVSDLAGQSIAIAHREAVFRNTRL
jgi:hypothetical protein